MSNDNMDDVILVDLVKKIEELERLSNIELEEVPWNTRPGMEAAKRQAVVDLRDVFKELEKEVSTKIFKVALVNASTEESLDFLEKMQNEMPCFAVKSLYHEMAELVAPKLGLGSMFGSEAWFRLLEVLTTYSRAARLVPSSLPQQPQAQGVKNLDHLADIIQGVIEKAYGPYLYAAHIKSMVTSHVLSTKFTKLYFGVIIPVSSNEEAVVINTHLWPQQPSFVADIDAGPINTHVKKITSKVLDGMDYKVKKQFTDFKVNRKKNNKQDDILLKDSESNPQETKSEDNSNQGDN